MLSNYLWNGNYNYWNGEDHPNSSSRRGHAYVRDEEEKDLEGTVHDLDELADRLLTQFPTYGTKSHSSSKDAQVEDWLQNDEDDDAMDNNGDGENKRNNKDDDETKGDDNHQRKGRGNARVTVNQSAYPGMLSMSMPSPAASANSSSNKAMMLPNNGNNNINAVNFDWDYDEQFLWKAVAGDKSNEARNKYNRNQIESTVQTQHWTYGENSNYHQPPPDKKSNNNDNRPGANNNAGTAGPSGKNSSNSSHTDITTATGASTEGGGTVTGANPHDIYNSRQHWMPDQLCKHCYLCDTPFTVFRRRHHCRLCGQVFCSNCSSFFVPSQKKGSSTLRTCQMCFEQVTQKGGLLMEGNNNNAKDGTSAADGTNNSTDPNNNSNATTTDPISKTITEDRRDETGRPVVTDHKTLTIQTQTTPKSTKSNDKDDSTASGDKTQVPPPPPPQHQKPTRPTMAWMESRDYSTASGHDISTQAHWKAAIKQESPDSAGSNSNNNGKNGSKEGSSTDTKNAAAAQEAKRHLGLTAANHLEKMGEALLKKDAPLLWEELEAKQQQDDPSSSSTSQEEVQKQWLHKLMTLATRCCATVEPNVKKGDLLDIRPYVKIKVIPGGSVQDCAYLSGIVFRKTVSHKKMAKEVRNPRILLLNGGIGFERSEQRYAHIHQLLQGEGRYMELLVGNILKLKPNVVCVARSVSRRALELFLKANVVLIQHVKSTLMSRISRQTGASIISSTDHIMNQFGPQMLGECSRFRLVTFRDNEIWKDPLDHDDDIYKTTTSATNSQQRSIRNLLKTPDLANHERQAALAANVLGDGVVDGAEAVKSGVAKRGVAQTFVMLEGCPKHLGCSVVLRGASRAALKQVKRVFRFLVNVAYNLRLEMSYLKERYARIRPDFHLEPRHIFSSSLCVDYGSPPPGRKMVRPWNGGSNETQQRSLSGEITAFDHQSILITSVWMTENQQCCPAEVKGICYYSLQDVSLGQFLRDSCFNLSLKCQNPTCKKSVDDHSLLFVHKDGVIKITVEHMDGPLPPPTTDGKRKVDDETSKEDNDGNDEVVDSPIATWTYCKNCSKVVTPLVYISENTWKFSFGKFLEVFFYNRDAVMNACEYGCSCPMQTGTMLYFGCGKLAARFSYERVHPLGVFVRKALPIDLSFHRKEALIELERIAMSSSKLFVRFDKHIDRVAREARSLFGSAANRPEHLQTVLSELNRIGSEVDHAALTLQEKIASVSDKCRREGGVVNEAFFRFPWFSRRYLFMLTSAWNERLSAAGQAIVAMKKLASSASLRGDGGLGPNVPLAGTEELTEAMRRLRQLNEVYSHYNVTDITTVLPTIPGKQEEEFDDDFEDVDVSIDFADGVDADVLASRRRLNNSKSMGSGPYSHLERGHARGQLHKTLGTQRSFDSSHIQQETMGNAQPRVTPGGAVKSAITRFFNRGGRESDPYLVDLGIFKDGRPRLEPGVTGLVVPVVDEQLCTVIAYSLASAEYARQFKSFSKMENWSEVDENGRPVEPRPVDPSSGAQLPSPPTSVDEKKSIEQRMLVRAKTHIKHTFRDYDEKGLVTCKFVCTTYWATQFHAVRQVFLSNSYGRKEGGSSASGGTSVDSESSMDVEQGYVQSLSSAFSWAASGGKSGASFARTSDDRFVIKCISRTELQMFLDCAPAYFEYLSKAFFHGLPTVLCKIVGVYQIGYHNRETGKRSMEQVAVMQNIFYDRKISRVFDLKGSLRGRFAAQAQSSKEDARSETPPIPTDAAAASSAHLNRHSSDGDGSSRHGERTTAAEKNDGDDTTQASSAKPSMSKTQLDGDFLAFTRGRPMPLADRAKSLFHMSIQNDTLFLSIINVLDYSILVGIDEEKMELVVGIIDFMRQYDILKQMERVGKSLPMVVGSEAPTIIQPPLYKARFTSAMERYFMTVPCKWTTI